MTQFEYLQKMARERGVFIVPGGQGIVLSAPREPVAIGDKVHKELDKMFKRRS